MIFCLFLRERLEAFGDALEGLDSAEWSLSSVDGFLVASCYAPFSSLRVPFRPPNRYDAWFEKRKCHLRLKSLVEDYLLIDFQ